MFDSTDDSFLTIEEAADLLRVKRRTLDNLRWQGLGPKFRRHGGRVVYRRSDLMAWSEQRTATTTAQQRRRMPSFPDDRSRNDQRPRDANPEKSPALAHLERQPQRSDRPLPGEGRVGG